MGIHEHIAEIVESNGIPIDDIETLHHFTDGVYCKEMHVPAGFLICKHKHSYDHISVLAKGKALVVADEILRIYTAPAVIDIKANVMHAVEAIEDSVWLCIHATDEKDKNHIDRVIVERGR